MKSFIWQICTGLHTLYSCYTCVINVKLCEGGGYGYVLVVLYINYFTETKQVNTQLFFFHYSLIPSFLE